MTTGIIAAGAAPLVLVALSRPRSRCSAASAGGSSRVVTVPAKDAHRRRTGSANAPDPRPTRRASRLLRDLGASRRPIGRSPALYGATNPGGVESAFVVVVKLAQLGLGRGQQIAAVAVT